MKTGRAELVGMAWAIVDMDHQLRRQEEELEELRGYRQKYTDLLKSSIARNEAMLGGVLQIALTPRAMEAINTHNKAES